jgi:hypothetical protein
MTMGVTKKRRDVRRDPETGELVQVIPLADQVDLVEPQKDEDGKIPEFVNVSNRIQLVCVPNNPGATIEVPRWGILKGSQWRHYSEESRQWGRTPPFTEREPLKEDVKGSGKKGEYDRKYLLTQEQVIDIIDRLGRSQSARARIRSLADNQVLRFDKDGNEEMVAEVKSPNHFVPIRDRDDRIEVLQAENAKIRAIEDYIESQRKKTGVMV